jgi:hypothetical protein
LEAAAKELEARVRATGEPIILAAPAVGPGLRARTYRALARIQATTRSRDKLLDWIRKLPAAESRFYAYIGAGEGIRRRPSAGIGDVISFVFTERGPFARGAIDLDAATVCVRPEGLLRETKEGRAWTRKHGIDAAVVKLDLRSTAEDVHLIKLWLACPGMVVIPTGADRWDSVPKDIVKDLDQGMPQPKARMTTDAGLPATFLFKTSRGSVGVLQIVGVVKSVDSQRLAIRYKLLGGGEPPSSSATPSARR